MVCVVIHSAVSNSVTPWTVANQAPLFMDFPRQEYWSGLPFPPPGDLSDPGMEPAGLCLLHSQVGSLLLAPPMQILNGSLLGIHRLQRGRGKHDPKFSDQPLVMREKASSFHGLAPRRCDWVSSEISLNQGRAKCASRPLEAE